MTMQSYPVHLISTWRSPQGEPVTLRPIRPEDAAIEQAFVRGLSAESRRFRFMDGLRELTPPMLARFTQIDYDREMALIATVLRGGAEIEIGVCRYITHPDDVSCEYAIVIADDWQRRGLGRRMMTQLIAVARTRGLQTMIGHVMGSNRGMLSLCQSLGFVLADDAEDPAVKRVTLALND
ncbi:MAG: GNAT family N-acetyltransferase [Betaproteobacteria bacterium]